MDIFKKMEAAIKKVVEISYGQLWTIIIGVCGSMLFFWKTTDVRLTSVELRVTQQEMINTQVVNKLDKLQEGINDVRLTLRDKADRK